MMELYNNQFLVLECLTENIEMYQVKTFYYQKILGIREFRYSMSQNKSYLYFPIKEGVTLPEFLQSGMSKKELYRILEQIKCIFDESNHYLLYQTNISLNPQWMTIHKTKNDLKIELLYIPLKELKEFNEYYEQFVGFIATAFNQMDDMEGFYYFIRIVEDLKEGKETLKIDEHLSLFLSRGEKSWKKEKSLV